MKASEFRKFYLTFIRFHIPAKAKASMIKQLEEIAFLKKNQGKA